MLTLTLAMRDAGEEGEPLPIVFPQLDAVGARPRRGSVIMVAAAPGGGKSAWMSEYAINVAGENGKLSGMYFSADTDRMTLGKRAAAGIIGCEVDEAEKYLKENRYNIWDRTAEATEHIWMCFDAGLTLDDIEAEVKAFAAVNGAWPEFIVIDVLMNVQGDSSSGDHTAYAQAMEWLHQLARTSGAAVFVLHHVTGNWENGDEPIPLSGILGKVTKFPRLILTIYRPMEGFMGVCVVKNSNGPMDPTANDDRLRVKIPWNPARSWFGRNPKDIQAMSSLRVVDTIRKMDEEEEDETSFRVWN